MRVTVATAAERRDFDSLDGAIGYAHQLRDERLSVFDSGIPDLLAVRASYRKERYIPPPRPDPQIAALYAPGHTETEPRRLLRDLFETLNERRPDAAERITLLLGRYELQRLSEIDDARIHALMRDIWLATHCPNLV